MSNDLRVISTQLKQYIDMLEGMGVKYVPAFSEEVIIKASLRGASEGGDEAISDSRFFNSAKSSAKQDGDCFAPAGLAMTSSLMALRAKVIACSKCSELANNRNTVVFGSGHTNAELVFVGEAPGFHEDQQGLPFVGRAGELLTKMIEAMGLKRKDVFICNVLKCRPPNNRNPGPEEVLNCEPYLIEQLKLIGPKVICAMGNFAAQTLLRTQRPISQIRGSVHDYKGIPCVATFHPAYLLRNPVDKRKAWEDLKTVMQILGLKSKK